MKFFPGCNEIDLGNAINSAMKSRSVDSGTITEALDSNTPSGGASILTAVESAALGSGKYKCRILYSSENLEISIAPYTPRKIASVRLVFDDDIDYSHKYTDRTELDRLFARRGDADMILIVNKGRITDTTFSNVALFDGADWIVPDTYLLPGTMRQYLLDTGMVRPSPVSPEDLHRYEKISFINALLELGESELPIKSVVE